MKKKIAFIIAGFFVFLLILEIALRISGLLYVRFSQVSNKPVSNKKGVYTILCLGDSFTLGIGGSKGHSYPEQLEILLNSGGLDKKFKVFREFRINSSTVLANLKQDLQKYKPDSVIIMTGCNDRWSMENCRFFGAKNGNLPAAIDAFLHVSRVYKLIKISFLNIDSALGNLFQSPPDIYRAYRFNNNEAEQHFQAGNNYLLDGKFDLALEEFKAAERFEPEQVLVNFRLASMSRDYLRNEDLTKKYALRALSYGDSAIIGYTFMFLFGSNYIETKENKKIAAEMEAVIRSRYRGSDKERALIYLRNFFLVSTNIYTVADILEHNLTEIIRILKKNNIQIVLMEYPMSIGPESDKAIAERANSFGIPLINNKELFGSKISRENLKKESFFAEDGHCNAAGYGLVAENVYNLLVKNIIIANAKLN
ncbi:MAG: hypothetical protein KJ722_04040 [Candidatus Omnitrophica bacterium]|nr:hypothetical protein [Candidatus Omnitrophota bacterium]MBU2221771.1 hypothetical protein [Candidatus Omnitrophota bacterium]